jgi:hypothetical protein
MAKLFANMNFARVLFFGLGARPFWMVLNAYVGPVVLAMADQRRRTSLGIRLEVGAVPGRCAAQQLFATSIYRCLHAACDCLAYAVGCHAATGERHESGKGTSHIHSCPVPHCIVPVRVGKLARA